MRTATIEKTLNPAQPTKWSQLDPAQITGFVIMIDIAGEIVYKEWLRHQPHMTTQHWNKLLRIAESNQTVGLSRVTSYRDNAGDWHNLLR